MRKKGIVLLLILGVLLLVGCENESGKAIEPVRAGLIFTTRGQENSYHHIAA